jgi:hypothetical protein
MDRRGRGRRTRCWGCRNRRLRTSSAWGRRSTGRVKRPKYSDDVLVYKVSFFEIYGGRLFDLLNNRNKLLVQEDANQKIQVSGLTENEVKTPEAMLKTIEFANNARTTRATTSNDTSSRSHAICQIAIRSKDDRHVGKLLLVDLAVRIIWLFMHRAPKGLRIVRAITGKGDLRGPTSIKACWH